SNKTGLITEIGLVTGLITEIGLVTGLVTGIELKSIEIEIDL
ncbi:5078_t:CDS:1, partial [Funneliformis caledonium]